MTDDPNDDQTDGRADEPSREGSAPEEGGRGDGRATGDRDAAPADGLHIQLFSIHGLIRARDLELGRDADTGGQTKYLVEFACALGEAEGVAQVDLFTRLVDDKRVSDDYARPIEPIGERSRIVRIKAGGKAYRRKELLWTSLDEFVEGVLRFDREHGIVPDLVHGHYADAGYVAMEIASYLGAPLVFTGHSLGRNKRRVLLNAGLDEGEIERQYHLERRIAVEEEVLRKADLVIASTEHEVRKGYELYEAHEHARYEVIPPGIQVEKFYPYFYDLDPNFDPGPEVIKARVRMTREIERFLREPEKPMILAISRPDRRKNIEGLVTAYGEDKELQSIANLAVFAGVRKDIRDMDDNEREVLTEMLLLMDRYDLYGKMALPKKHEPDVDIPVLYRIAAARRGVFINPALVENFGITVIEAASSGLPVVSTDHGGPQTILENTGAGELVDARDTEQIRAALKRVLVDEELWERYSAAGVEGVRAHYAWAAHAATYLGHVRELLEEQGPPREEPRWRTRVGRRLQTYDRLLISDIDYTLVHEGGEGDPAALERLAEAIREHGIGFGVATGRSLELVEEVLAAHGLPRPEIVISSVGTEIYYGEDRLLDRGYGRHLSYRWKRDEIGEALDGLDFLVRQEPETQRSHKLSWYMEPGGDGGAGRLERVREVLAERGLRANVIYSHDRFLDVLPHRASKGKAIRYLAHKWGMPSGRIAVAGDSGNDEEMLRGPFRGIVVGNHAAELEALRGARRVYFSEGAYAAGVLEGLEHWGFLEG